MAELAISLIVEGVQFDDEFLESFHNRFDGTVSATDGYIVVTLDVDDAPDRDQDTTAFVYDKIRRLELATGARVVRIDLDLVNTTEIAIRLGRTRQQIRKYATGENGKGFPRPYGQPSGVRVWDWGSVQSWAVDQGLSDPRDRSLTWLEAIPVDHRLLASRSQAALTTA